MSPVSAASKSGTGAVDACRVLGVVARHGFQHDRRIAHVAGDGSGLVERGGEGDDAPARAAPVGGLHADDAGQAPPAGGSSRRYRSPWRRRRYAAETAAAEPPEEPPGTRSALEFLARHGFIDRAVIGGLVGRAHGELVHVELAQHHRAVAEEIGGDGRFVRGLEGIEHVAGGLGMHALGGRTGP